MTQKEIKCPNCGSDYLHHDEVAVFFRDEDAQTGLAVVTSKSKSISSDNISGNPSPRRSGLYINFWCEDCDAKPRMEIVQHKGITYMSIKQ